MAPRGGEVPERPNAPKPKAHDFPPTRETQGRGLLTSDLVLETDRLHCASPRLPHIARCWIVERQSGLRASIAVVARTMCTLNIVFSFRFVRGTATRGRGDGGTARDSDLTFEMTKPVDPIPADSRDGFINPHAIDRLMSGLASMNPAL